MRHVLNPEGLLFQAKPSPVAPPGELAKPLQVKTPSLVHSPWNRGVVFHDLVGWMDGLDVFIFVEALDVVRSLRVNTRLTHHRLRQRWSPYRCWSKFRL